MEIKPVLIDGMNVTAIISLQKATVPAVPADAIITLQGRDYIFYGNGQPSWFC